MGTYFKKREKNCICENVFGRLDLEEKCVRYRPLQALQHQYSREDSDDEKAGFGLSLLGAI